MSQDKLNPYINFNPSASPGDIVSLDVEEFGGFKVGQLVKVAVDDLLHPWRVPVLKSVGIVTGFFKLHGTTSEVRGAPLASCSFGAHVLIGHTSHKYHISYLAAADEDIQLD